MDIRPRWTMICLSFLTMTCCGKTTGAADPISGVEKPKIVSSTLTDGDEGVPAGEQTFLLVFDQNITLPQPSNIKLNGKSIQGASAAFKELRIPLELVKSTDYILVIGANSIKGPTGLFADALEISFRTSSVAVGEINTQLVTTDPSPEAEKVYKFLYKNYGENLISGAMANVSWNTNEATWIHRHTGKYPALNCFDYIHLYASPTSWIDYGNTQIVEDWWQENGLVAAMWHWNVPTTESSNSYAFYTEETMFDITKAVVAGTYEHGVVMDDLERIADHLLLLKDKDIPIIWRPLHEASGTWFWWGAKGAEAYKKLWVMMFDTFRQKGLNNLIWVWTSEADDGTWYPGDAYVDIIGVDLYDRTNTTEVAPFYTKLKETYPDKMIALSEFGNVAALSDQWNRGISWSWIMPWYDYERTADLTGQNMDEISHQFADINYWNALFAFDRVITRDQMPSLK